MISMISNRRSDAYLMSILHTATRWSVTGAGGTTLCEVANLHCAVEQAMEFGARGNRIVALIREREPEIVVSPGQFRKLMDQVFDPADYLINATT